MIEAYLTDHFSPAEPLSFSQNLFIVLLTKDDHLNSEQHASNVNQ
jgi:hypothetical protein